MTEKKTRSGSADDLRRRAEEKARADEAKTQETLSPEQARQVLHELRVHQIELEIQNEELRRTQAELEESRARYFDLYDLAPVGYFTLSEQGLILEANLTAATLLGVERGALVKKPLTRFILPEDQDIYYLYRKQLFETGAPQGCALRVLKKDGDHFWAWLEATAAQDADGAPVCRAVMSDITERKQAEKNILNLNRMYSVLGDINQTIIKATDQDHLFREICRIAVDIGKFNFSWVGILDQEKKTVIPSAHAGRRTCPLLSHVRSLTHEPGRNGPVVSAIQEKKCTVENNVLSNHCMEPWWEKIRACGCRSLAVAPLFFKKEVFGVFTVCADEIEYFTKDEITLLEEISGDISFALDSLDEKEQRQKAEEQVRESEEQYRSLVESTDDSIYQVDRGLTYLYANKKCVSRRGVPINEIVHHHYGKFHTPSETEGFSQKIEQVFLSGNTLVYEQTSKKDGRRFVRTLSPVHNMGGGISSVIIIAKDITELRETEHALRESENKYQELAETLPQPVFETDVSGVLTYANRKTFEQFGYSMEDFNRRINILDLIVKEDLERAKANFAKMIQHALTDVHEYTARRKDGSTFPVSVYSTSIAEKNVVKGIRGFVIDLTERIKAEIQLRQAQKMETVGQLAGGVAHDFNNILMAIMGYSQFALRALPEDSPAHNDILEVLKNSERAGNLTKQLLAFSRRQRLEPRIADLNALLAELAKMLRRLIGEHIELAILLEPNLWNVKVDPTQIEQVIINLAVNARDAMPRGGKLTISTANAELSDTPTAEVLIPGGSYVLVSVADTGMGMDEEVKSHLFEPFFTTKEPGKGTGLGLATCYGIIKQSGGYIIAESEQGKGSVFTVYLPRESEETGPAESAEAITELPAGSETVLLAEDDASVRSIIARALSMQGYRVLEAVNGEEALHVIDRYGIENIRLLVTDMVMPLMGGEELATRVRELRPDIKVVFMSGYTDDSIFPIWLDESHTRFIQKPVIIEEFLIKIRSILNGK